MMKFFLLTTLVILPFLANADPSPFGLEISIATVESSKAKYHMKYAGENRYNAGDMYNLNVEEISIEGLQSATAIFDKEKKLVAILTTFSKNKFDYLFSTMKKKYKMSSKNIPFVGNKSATFKNGNSTIVLNAPHLSFQMSMNYINNDFQKTYQEIKRKEAQAKRKAEQSKL